MEDYNWRESLRRPLMGFGNLAGLERLELFSEEKPKEQEIEIKWSIDFLDEPGSRFKRLRRRKEGPAKTTAREIAASGIRESVWNAAEERWKNADR